MIHLRLTVPARLATDVLDVLRDDPAVSSLSWHRGASVDPAGDVIEADVARVAANEVVERLRALAVHRVGTVQLEPVATWLSSAGYRCELANPGSGSDAVVWAQVTQRAYEDSELNWTFVSFLTMATLLAGIAIVVDSQILTVGAMVLGPEFGAVAALGLALVRRRWHLLRYSLGSLVVGFVLAMAGTTVLALAGRALGWLTLADVAGPRPATDFIYHPSRWSLLVAVIAGAAGVLSLTSSKVGGLTGVFISVTTIPAAGNVALALAVGAWSEVGGSLAQLGLNIVGMALAGWLTLLVQQVVWSRVSQRRGRALARRRATRPDRQHPRMDAPPPSRRRVRPRARG